MLKCLDPSVELWQIVGSSDCDNVKYDRSTQRTSKIRRHWGT